MGKDKCKKKYYHFKIFESKDKATQIEYAEKNKYKVLFNVTSVKSLPCNKKH